MTVSAAQYAKFNAEIAQTGRAFTFTNHGELLIYPVRGQEVVPFWSSRSRLEKIQIDHPKYQRHEIAEYSLAEFLSWLAQLEEERILVGVNWSGAKLTGYNVAVPELRPALEHQLASLAQRAVQPDGPASGGSAGQPRR
jgi:hypothetical protein